MNKHEKVKLLIIGVLGLLLVATLPTTAAPLREPIYMLNDCYAYTNSELTSITEICTVGEVVGKVTISHINKQTNEIKMSYSIKNLEPGAWYVTELVPQADSSGTTTYTFPNDFLSGEFLTDYRGSFKQVIPTYGEIRDDYETMLDGGYFFGVISYPYPPT